MKTLFYQGNIYTGDAFAEAFLVEDGRFKAVGTDAELLQMDAEEKIDLNGTFVCAAFNDSHMHLLHFGQSLLSARLDEHTTSLKEMLDYLKDYIDEREITEGQWVLGRGYNQDYFSDVRRMPSRNDLDRISSEIPILLTRACGHSCVANSKVLELAGITKNTKAPLGGAIDFENGLFYDNAIELLEKWAPLPDKKNIKEMLKAGAAALNAYGITSCQTDDYCVFRQVPYETINEAYQELISDGELTVRVYEQANFTSLPELQRFLAQGNMTGKGDGMFRMGPLKLLGDGSLGARTAHLSKPYHDDPSNCGFSLFSEKEFHDLIGYAHRQGMQVAVHTIGDRCLDQVLDAYENALMEVPREDHRHGIVHCQITRADQLERMEKLKLHIYAQSIFLDYDNHIVEQRVGKELAATSYSWKTLMDQGLTVSNGSDAPVEMPDVLRGIQCAITRSSIDGTGPYLPKQAFSVKEALDSFTIASAKASFEEKQKGRIAEGYQADFVVLEKDPFQVDPEKLHKIKVLSTYLNGKLVYQADE